MRDNRFSDCATVADALLRYRALEVVDADDDFELTARLRQLQPPTVNDDQRTRAISAAIDYRSRPADVLVDRIIEALGFGQKITPAPAPIPAPSFDGCETVRDVLRLVAHRASWTDYRDGIEAADARIAELTARLVHRARGEREVTDDWWLNTTGMSRANADQLTDRIIDALGYTAAEPQMTTDKYGRNACVCGYVPPTHTHADDCPVFGTQARAQAPTPAPATPAVELDADDLSALSDRLREWADLAFNIGVDEDHEIPTGVGRIAYSEATGKWVLRIGGDQ